MSIIYPQSSIIYRLFSLSSLLSLLSLTSFSLIPIHNSRGIIGLLVYCYCTIIGLLLYYSYETIGKSICRKRPFRPGSHRFFCLILGLIVSPFRIPLQRYYKKIIYANIFQQILHFSCLYQKKVVPLPPILKHPAAGIATAASNSVKNGGHNKRRLLTLFATN